MVYALWRLEGSILEVVCELAIRSRDPHLLCRPLCLPEADLALSFAVVAAGESTNQAVLKLSLCHGDDEVLRWIDRWIVVTSLVNVVCAKLNHSCVSVEQVLQILPGNEAVICRIEAQSGSCL